MFENIIEHISNITAIQFVFCWSVGNCIWNFCIAFGMNYSKGFRKVLAKHCHRKIHRLMQLEGHIYEEGKWVIEKDGSFHELKQRVQKKEV
jgi:hypothetical protein